MNQFRGADDHLNIDGTTYEGTNCPQGVQLTARSTIAWTSDGSVAGDGWEICAGAEDTLRSDPLFTVVSGPCTLEMDGTCVGRPSGYSDSERCQIASTGSVHLSNCPIFNTERGCEAANRLASPPDLHANAMSCCCLRVELHQVETCRLSKAPAAVAAAAACQYHLMCARRRPSQHWGHGLRRHELPAGRESHPGDHDHMDLRRLCRRRWLGDLRHWGWALRI